MLLRHFIRRAKCVKSFTRKPFPFMNRCCWQSTMLHVNKPSLMCLEDFDCIGLDIDHTLCKYKLDNFFRLSYDFSAKILVEEKGYDESLLQPFEIHKDLCIKGMVFDLTTGDFLKLSDSGIILRASHGTKALSSAEIEAKYGKHRAWEHFPQLAETLEQTDKIRYTENYYDLPFMVLLARIVDLEEHKGALSLKKYSDVLDAYVGAFLYKEGRGSILETCEQEPDKYLEPCSEHLKTWLRNLQDKCQMVFLLSSAQPVFAHNVMNYILGEDWPSSFNLCLLEARKPGFFSKDPSTRPFYSFVDGQKGPQVTELEEGQCYIGGNAKALNDYFKKVTGKENPKVLYFGDSIRSDIHPSSVYSGWQSVLVLEEMEVEELIPNGTCALEGAVNTTNPREGPSQLEREFLLSNQWGSFFGDHLPVSPSVVPIENDGPTNDSRSNPIVVNTLWTRFMKNYASIAIPKMDYMADFPTDFKFETFASDDWRKGYHPGMPKNVC